jgi:predicted dehydrogenase
MGKAHTHAYTDIPIYFDPKVEVIKDTLCSNEADVVEYAKRWGYRNCSLDWREVVANKDIDLVDIVAPSTIHAQVAIEAAKQGKHVLCEKPLALNLDDARAMVNAVEQAGVVNMIGFNYRRVPAIVLAKQLIEEGKIGEIYHFRGYYMQDWLVDPKFPLVWRCVKKDAGYGGHGDMGAHIIDLARYLVGDIDDVCCLQRTFIKQRPLPMFMSGLSATGGSDKMGDVDVDDASQMMLRFSGRETMGYVEVSRFHTGHKNKNMIEINGSRGSIIFDLERMNELEYFDRGANARVQGFTNIQVSEAVHPFIENYWPSGHIIGWADTQVNQMYDLICAIRDGIQVHADFRDGLKCQLVLDAAQRSAETLEWTKVAED